MSKLNNKIIAMPLGLRNIGISLITLIISFLCLIFAFKIGLQKIDSQNNDIKKIEKNILVLNNKKDILLKVKESLLDDVKFFSIALPDFNPSLSIIFQIKNYVYENLLIIDNLKSSNESKFKNINKVDITFDLNGSFDMIIDFLKETKVFSPITTIEKLELSHNGQIFRATVGLRGYWAPLPTKIPAVNQPLSDFSDEENEIILKISELRMPEVTTSIIPQGENLERENPFE